MPGNAPHETPADKVLKRIAQGDPPHKVKYQRGSDTAEEEFVGTRQDCGNGRIELEYEDGRHVTFAPHELLGADTND